MKKWNWLCLGALLLMALAGCGGGNGSGTLQNFNNLRVNLGNGQTVTLNLAIRNAQVTGTMIVPAPVAARDATPRDLGFTLPPGTYQLTGEFTPPRGFTATGSYQNNSGQTVPFTITGQVPTTSEAGSFTFTALGQSVSGTIPPITQN
jgi:hypothetical protein